MASQPTLTPAQLSKLFRGHNCKRAGCIEERQPDGAIKTIHKIGSQLLELTAMPPEMSKAEAFKLIGERLRQARLKAGKSVGDLSRVVGQKDGAVYKAEQGATIFSLPALLRYCRAVGLSLDELFDEISLPMLRRAKTSPPTRTKAKR